MEDIKVKEDLRSRLSEYKSEMSELFRNGYPSDTKGHSKDIVLPALSFLAGLIIASVICFFIEFSLLSGSTEAKYTLAERMSGRAPSLVYSMKADPYQDFSALNPLGALMPDKSKGSSENQSYQIKDMGLAGTLRRRRHFFRPQRLGRGLWDDRAAIAFARAVLS